MYIDDYSKGFFYMADDVSISNTGASLDDSVSDDAKTGENTPVVENINPEDIINKLDDNTKSVIDKKIVDATKAAIEKAIINKDIADAKIKEVVERKSKADKAKATGDMEALIKTKDDEISLLTNERDELLSKISNIESITIRTKIATKYGIPDMVDRLVGETEIDLEEDAKNLAKRVNLSGVKITPPNMEGGSKYGKDSKAPEDVIKSARKANMKLRSGW